MERVFGTAAAVLFFAAWVGVFLATWQPDNSGAIAATALLLFFASGSALVVWMSLFMERHDTDRRR